MSEKRKKAPSFVTPRGTFVFPRLTEADTKFKAAGEYSVKLRLTKDAAADLVKALAPMHAEAVKTGKKEYAALKVETRKKLDAKGGFNVVPLFTPCYDDDENETNEIEFNFKMTASGESKKTGKKWERRPVIFDAKGKPMGNVQVWGGTIGKVSFDVGLNKEGEPGYFIPGTGSAGLSLRLNSVQVLDLVSKGERSAASYGFSEEEGYEYNEADAEAAAEADTDTAAKPGENKGDEKSGVDF